MQEQREEKTHTKTESIDQTPFRYAPAVFSVQSKRKKANKSGLNFLLQTNPIENKA